MLEANHISDKWKKLQKWPQILSTFRQAVLEGLSETQTKVMDLQSDLRGSLAHLHGLAESHSDIKLQKLIQNFRGAAMHYTLIKEMAHSDSDLLPGIPDAGFDIVQQSQFGLDAGELAKFTATTRKKMDTYLKDYNGGELRLPLHLSLLITPLFMLMPINLAKCQFPRASIHEVSFKSFCGIYLSTESIIVALNCLG
jgi:hypothetical protein